MDGILEDLSGTEEQYRNLSEFRARFQPPVSGLEASSSGFQKWRLVTTFGDPVKPWP